jgi:hypothetical protein
MESGRMLNGDASAWISARVGGDQTGPTRAPNRRLPVARVANPLRAQSQQF